MERLPVASITITVPEYAMRTGVVTERTVQQVVRNESEYRANQHRHGSEPCILCGRKVGKRNLYAASLDGNDVVSPEDAAWLDENLVDWLGWYRVGSECAKRLPAGWVKELPPIA